MARKEVDSGSPLRKERRGRGIQIKSIAREMGYHPSYISGVEVGSLVPSREFLERYAKALGMPSAEFLYLVRSRNSSYSRIEPQAGRPASQPVRPGDGVRYRQVKEISGQRQVLSAANQLVESAAESEGGGSRILVEGLDWDEYRSDYPGLVLGFRQGLKAALRQRWQVHQLIRKRFVGDETSTLISRNILNLVGVEGGYYLTRERDDGADRSHFPMVCVSGIGALVLVNTKPENGPDSALLFQDGPPQALVDHIESKIAAGYPVLKTYSRRDPEQRDAITRLEELPGDRMLVNPHLGSETLSPSDYEADSAWYQSYVRGFTDKQEDDERIAETQRRSAIAFRDQLASCRFLQIARTRSIHHWARTGLPADFLHSYGHPDYPGDRIVRLKNAIGLMTEYGHDNFKIALVDDNESPKFDQVLPHANGDTIRSWAVMNNRGVLISMVRPGKAVADLAYSIDEPDVVASFESYFSESWENLSARSRDTQHVVSWLQMLVRMIEADG